jgi:Flp pilus assembly protein TadD
MPDAEAALASLAGDRRQPAIVRATALHQRGFLRAVTNLTPEILALTDEDAQVRKAAVTRLGAQIPATGSQRLSNADITQLEASLAPLVRQIVGLLDDPRRAVRAETGRVLAQLPGQLKAQLLSGNQRVKLDRALDEYTQGILESNDRGGAHMELGVLYESLGRDAAAESAYRTAIRVEPRMTGPRSNLAAVLERLNEADASQNGPGNTATQAGQLRSEEVTRLRREELDLLARDARLLPTSAPLQYRYGLSLYLHDQPVEAEKALQAACVLEPDNEQYLYALVLFYDKYARHDEARGTLDKLLQLAPNHPDYLRLRDELDQKFKPPTPQ